MAADVWTFVTYAFIHGDLNHLFFNAVWLLAFASPVARRFGAVRFLLFYGVTAAAGAAVHLATHFGELLPMIGASAAISGAMAAAMRFAFQPGGPLGLWGGSDEAYRVPAVPLTVALRDQRLLAFLLVWFGVNALFGLGLLQDAGHRAGGRLAGAYRRLSWPVSSPLRCSIRCGARPTLVPERRRRSQRLIDGGRRAGTVGADCLRLAAVTIPIDTLAVTSVPRSIAVEAQCAAECGGCRCAQSRTTHHSGRAERLT